MVPTSNRSTFVTVVAWIFIVGSGFATLVSAMQNVMFHLVFKDDELAQVPDELPGIAAFMFENFQLVVLAVLLVSLSILISSIGLLKRKNWARLAFIVLMSLGIIWNLGGIVLQDIFLSSAPPMSNHPEFRDFQTMQSIMRWFSAIVGIGLAGLFGWIIWRLTRESVRREFMA
jgi:hypothetical protein